MTSSDTRRMLNGTCFVSRQAIFNPSMKVAAYDLQSNYTSAEEPEKESIRALFEMFTDSELDLVIGDHTGMVTITPPALAEGLWKYVPPDRVMIAVSSLLVNEGTVDQLLAIAAEGYSLVIDESQATECSGLLNSGKHAVKVDVTRFAPDQLAKRVQQLRKHKAKILANGVDT